MNLVVVNMLELTLLMCDGMTCLTETLLELRPDSREGESVKLLNRSVRV